MIARRKDGARSLRGSRTALNSDSTSLPRVVPESTSAEGMERYLGGKPLAVGRGDAWRDINAWIVAPPPTTDSVRLPAVSEPFLAWTISGEVDFQEREIGGSWITHRIRRGSFFLTFGGAPYDVKWKTVTAEPFEAMMVFVGLPLLRRAFDEVFGKDARYARLKDLSGFSDSVLGSLVGQLRDELLRARASPLLVHGIGLAVAIHLARNYAELVKRPRSASPSLPGHKLRRITEWMSEHLADEIDLGQLAAKAELSKFYFQRLFKSAIGSSPARYQVTLRMDAARLLLRETRRSVVDIALEVGYANPSHFASLFRRETGLSPSEYRRQS